MEIAITHLTRMADGYICAAGNDMETMQHIRPVLRGQRIQSRMLAERGGPFVIGGIVDIGDAKPDPQPPETEDHLFFGVTAKRIGMLEPDLRWQTVSSLAERSLVSIFGPDLTHQGRSCTVVPESGSASLGFLVPAEPPVLVLQNGDNGRRIRIDVTDGEINCNLSVTDVRLFRENDLGDWVPQLEIIAPLRRHLLQGQPVVLAVGLTRAFARDAGPPLHYLQVNNIHVQDHSIFEQS